MLRQDKSKEEWQFLKNVGSSYELELITSILAQERILVMKKSKGSGAYTDVIMGASLTGYDIYVPAKRLAEAREIIDNLPVFKDDEIDFNEPPAVKPVLSDASETEVEDGFMLRNRHIFKILFFIFVLIPLIFGLVVALFMNFRSM
ncbi:MAG TPA: DUF2007 domain-containing protein [Syntrophomonas sp.]|nr:DUF2007 domain-containing protein [Syntrophomonas sp.]